MEKNYLILNLKYTTECEACGHKYSWTQITQTEEYYTKSHEEILQLYEKEIESGKLSANKPCPECNFIQSWMVFAAANDKRDSLNNWGVLFGIALVVLSAFTIGWSVSKHWQNIFIYMGLIILPVLIIKFLPDKVFKINKSWYDQNGYKDFAVKRPTIEIIELPDDIKEK